MATAKDTCSGCGREFAPGGFANHLHLSDDPRCHRFRDGLMPGYSAASLDLPTHSLDSHATPDVPMLDDSNERPEPDIIPSPSPPHLHFTPIDNIMEDEDNMDFEGGAGDFEDEVGNSEGGAGDFEDEVGNSEGETGNFEGEVGDLDPSLGEIFHRSTQPPIMVTDLDTESESSDEEGEDLQPHLTIPPLRDSLQDSVQHPSSTQPGKNFCVMIDLPLTII
jgi:hypothetical protein